MSAPEGKTRTRLDSAENVRQLLDGWGESLAQVLESMTDQRPEIHWQAESGTDSEVSAKAGGGGGEVLWWEQPLQISPEMVVWVAAPQAAWEQAGTMTLKAAGLETIETAEARNTWLEILGQSLSALARSIGGLLGREVTCNAGVERKPDAEIREWALFTLKLGEEEPAHLVIGFSQKLLATVATPSAAETERRELVPAAAPPPAPAEPPPVRSRTMDLLLDVDLPVSISFGRAQLPLKDVLKLTTGSIVELNRSVNEQVEVLVNNCLIARGEVVVVEGNYGVRIQEIVSRQDRLRSFR
jgi:flagellar motor switch protein FliN/FliY